MAEDLRILESLETWQQLSTHISNISILTYNKVGVNVLHNDSILPDLSTESVREFGQEGLGARVDSQHGGRDVTGERSNIEDESALPALRVSTTVSQVENATNLATMPGRIA